MEKVVSIGKVGSTGGIKGVSGSKKTSSAQSSGGVEFSSFLGGAADVSDTSSTLGASAVGGIEALLAAQSVGDALSDGGRKKRAVERGNTLLDRLEELRLAILDGVIPKSRLIELAQMLRERREEGLDPSLSALLDDIELRAEVELAKLSRNV